MRDHLASIITPLYNTKDFISDTIQSVLSQTYKDWELVIIDDCSTDGSYKLAKEFEKDHRIKVYKLPQNSGPAIARNKGIELAKGSYIAFLDSDDMWLPQKLERQIRFMEENNYIFSYTYYQLINDEGDETGKTISPPLKINYKDLLKTCYIGCLTAVYNAEKIGKVYMPIIDKRQDYGLWLKILRKGVTAYGLPESLALYRVHSKSISSNKFNLVKYNWKLFRKHENLSLMKSFYCLCSNIYHKLFK
jgi:glycosyltransferase involved in cell wall biosynthesis